MSTPAILDADMATLARWARTGFDWWRGELQALMPTALLARFNPQPVMVARFDADRLTLWRRGEPAAAANGPVALALAEAAVLTRTVQRPALGRADLRRLIALDADRLLPFPSGAALIDFETGARGSNGLQAVTVAGVPVEHARAALDAAAAAGLSVDRLGVAAADGRIRFDFLPAWRAVAGTADAAPRRFWWSVVAALFALNLAVLIGRDVYDLRATEALVTAHGETALMARTLRARVLGEDARQRAWLQRRAAQDPLPVLAAATRALPDAAWVQRLTWDGTVLRLAGYKTGPVDVVAALRQAPEFGVVRRAPGALPAASTTGEPFDVIAERRGAVR